MAKQARWKSAGRFSPAIVQQFLRENEAKTVEDVHEALKELFSGTLEAMLELDLSPPGLR